MSLQLLAQQIAAQGRGNDDQLVHMSKREVAGLQALAAQHGMRLPHNPQTGLIEANFLDSILPMAAGIGLMAFAPELTPFIGEGAAGFLGTSTGAGLAVGAADTLATGNLQKGLMAGLGAYGGAELGSALGAAGSATAPTVISSAPTVGGTASMMPSAGATGINNAADVLKAAQNPFYGAPDPSTLTQIPTGLNNASDVYRLGQAIPNQIPSAAESGLQNAGDVFRAAQGAQSAAPSLASNLTGQGVTMYPSTAASSLAPSAASSGLSGLGQGITSLGDKAGRAAFMDSLGATGPFESPGYNQLFKAGAVAAGPMMANSVSSVDPRQVALQNTVRPWTFTQTGNPAGMGTTNKQALNQTWIQGQPYNAITGKPMAGGGLSKGFARGETLHGTIGELRGVERLTRMASGGISNLGSYSDGGQLLRGPGDGVSDDIPAQIGQHQPARLAEGEFVVPARIVSELGNGSTNAGAKQLYAMIDRVQAGRRKTLGGKHAYANDTDATAHLPA